MNATVGNQALAAKYNSYLESFANLTDHINLVFSIIRVISFILTLATIGWNKDFSEPCFVCYQAIDWFSGCIGCIYTPYYYSKLNKDYVNESRDFRLA